MLYLSYGRKTGASGTPGTESGRFPHGCVEDGRYFLRSCRRQYDFIVHDTFSGETVPFHLLSREVFLDLRRVLTEPGVLALVFVGYYEGEQALAAQSVYRTLASVFSHVVAVAEPNDLEVPVNLLFFASARPLELPEGKWDSMSAELQRKLVTQQKFFSPSKGTLITDQRNALDLWQADKSERYRQWVLEEFTDEVLLN